MVAGDGFAGWHSLNDTIMGGRSQGQCQSGSSGLLMTAEVVAEGGGFVSCRSPLFSPPLDLSAQAGLQLELEGDGRRYKLAIACSDGLAGLTELIPGGLRWVCAPSPWACPCALIPPASPGCRFSIPALATTAASIAAFERAPCS